MCRRVEVVHGMRSKRSLHALDIQSLGGSSERASSLIEVSPPPPPILRVGGSSKRGFLPSFYIPFNQEIMEAPFPGKVKMPSKSPFEGATDPTDHLDVYKEKRNV